MKSKLNIAIVFLCFGGVILSSVSLWNHYSTAPTGYCDLDEMFNCDLVNRSTYARFMGVPVALIGLLGYLFLGAVSFLSNWRSGVVRLIASIAGLGFAFHLAYIEARVLAVWCLLCIGSLIAIASIFVLSSIAVWRGNRSGAATVTIRATESDEA